MQYYRLWESANLKDIGKYPQSINGIYVSTWNAEKSLIILFNEKVKTKDIEVPKILLDKKAKLTDSISASYLSTKRLISGKIKRLLEETKYDGIEFFNKSVIHNNKKNNDYWITNEYKFNNEYIDFKLSTIRCDSNSGTSFIKTDSLNSFDDLRKKGKVKIKYIQFIKQVF